jgi:putative ABC transport system substrate-binding protein
VRRRDFITLVGVTAAWPVVAWAQQARHVPIIGYVAPTNPLMPSRSTGAFLQRLRELGWIEGQTITIESRWAAGRPKQLDEIAAEFVRLKVDLIVTSSTNDSIVMKQVAPQIPMVLQCQAIRSLPAWSQVWRGRAGMLPAFRSSRPIQPVSGSNCCVRSSLVSIGWRS